MSFSLQNTASRVFIWQRVNQVIYFARNVLLALFITPHDYGDFATALNLASYVAILGTLEFRTAFFSTRELSEEQIRVQWSAEVLLNAISLLIGFALVPWFARTRSWAIIIAMLCFLAINLVNATFSSRLYLLEKDLQFPFLTAMIASVNFASFLICLLLAWKGWGLKALVVDRLLITGITWIILKKRSDWRPRFLLRKVEIRFFWGFARVLFLNGLLGKVLFGFDVYAVGKWIGSEANGIYNMAMKWALLPMELGGGFLAIMALSLYSRQSNESLEAFRKSYTEVTFHITRFCLAVAVLMAIFMQDFFRTFYKPAWAEVPSIFLALLPYAIFRPLYQNVCQALQARKELWPIFWVMLLQSLAAVILIFQAVPHGLLWVSLSTGCALGLGCLLLEIRLHQRISHPLIFLFAAPLFLALLTLAVLHGMPYGEGVNLRPLFLAVWHGLPQEMNLKGFGLRLLLALAYVAIAWWEWKRGKGKVSTG